MDGMTWGTRDDIHAERGMFSTTPSQVTESMIRSRRASCLSSPSGGDAWFGWVGALATALARLVVTHALTRRAVGSQGVAFVF